VKTTDKTTGKQAVGFDRPATAVDDFLESLLAPVDEYRLTQELLLPKVKPPLAEQSVTKAVDAAEQAAPSTEAALPDYFDQPFQCLFFKVGGSEFAVPLVSLSGIVKWNGKAGKLPGQPDWHRGVINYRDGKMALVDLSTLLGMDKPLQTSTFILAIDEGRFGLICESVYRPLTLRKEQVKWRQKRTDRRWMLGTLREQLCPLVDMVALAAMLH
jgi:purine-binding chemotaxis protein CheW